MALDSKLGNNFDENDTVCLVEPSGVPVQFGYIDLREKFSPEVGPRSGPRVNSRLRVGDGPLQDFVTGMDNGPGAVDPRVTLRMRAGELDDEADRAPAAGLARNHNGSGVIGPSTKSTTEPCVLGSNSSEIGPGSSISLGRLNLGPNS